MTLSAGGLWFARLGKAGTVQGLRGIVSRLKINLSALPLNFPHLSLSTRETHLSSLWQYIQLPDHANSVAYSMLILIKSTTHNHDNILHNKAT